MDENSKFIVRRTDSQERFEVLWDKRLNGHPTLKELAEMDEIINRDPLVQQFVLREMEKEILPLHNNEQDTPPPVIPSDQSLLSKIKSFLNRLTTLFISQSNLAIN